MKLYVEETPICLEVKNDIFDISMSYRVGSYAVDSITDKIAFKNNLVTFLRIYQNSLGDLLDAIEHDEIDLYKFTDNEFLSL